MSSLILLRIISGLIFVLTSLSLTACKNQNDPQKSATVTVKARVVK